MARAALCALAAATVALAVALAAGPGDAAAGGCVVKGGAIAGVARSRVLGADAVAVAYRVRGRKTDADWACRRGSARPVLIGRDDSRQQGGSEYGPAETLSAPHLAGGWVAAIQTTGIAAYTGCSKYMVSPCASPVDTLLAIDVASGARGSPARVLTYTTDAAGATTVNLLSRIVLSSAGAVAWLERSAILTESGPGAPVFTLYGCLARDGGDGTIACAPRQLAQGAVDPASLALAGTTLSFSVGGQPQTASLS